MAGQPSGDHPGDHSTNGSITGQQESNAARPEALDGDQTRADHEQRVDTAAARDAIAQARDRSASERDQAAALRDQELTSLSRRGAAADRAAAVEARARAALAREQAALDREQAARDRLHARAERDALLAQLAIAETDPLTGTRTRAPGLADLDREIDRARRTTNLLALAYVDVVGLKAENDAHGHAAGDALLQRAVHAIRGHLRSYDTIVRVGGDEFVCVMSGATIEDARQRFDAIHHALAGDRNPCEITVGFAALTPQDSATELIARADADLLTQRSE